MVKKLLDKIGRRAEAVGGSTKAVKDNCDEESRDALPVATRPLVHKG